MKKQKFMKLTAFASSPSLENSFSAPGTHNGKISVVFSGKSVKIHGWDGSAWSVIYTWNSVDKQFTFDNTFSNYFLESLTGGNETMGVSFFSVGRYQGSTPSLAGVTREVKLYDVDEVPIYTSSDDGKMLTIMSDGSLRWLASDATWMIDGSPVPGAPADPVISASVTISDDYFNLPNLVDANGLETPQLTKMPVGGEPVVNPSNDKIYTFSGANYFLYGHGSINEPYPFHNRVAEHAQLTGKEFSYSGYARTYSIWFKADDASVGNTNLQTLFSKWGWRGTTNSNKQLLGLFIYLQEGQIKAGFGTNTAYHVSLTPSTPLANSQWYHLVVVWGESSMKMYLNDTTGTVSEFTLEAATLGPFQTHNSTRHPSDLQYANRLTYVQFTNTNFGVSRWDNNFAIGATENATHGFVGELAYPQVFVGELTIEEINDGIHDLQKNSVV